MANTYTQIHIQIVFTVQNRQAQINKTWEAELYKYITGIVKNNGHKMLQINGTEDHIHLLIGMKPTQAISDLVKQIKQDSSSWINKKGFSQYKFAWQSGYGAFSYTREAIPKVINYIQNQKQHHTKKSFLDEYVELLKDFKVEYDDRYIFDSI